MRRAASDGISVRIRRSLTASRLSQIASIVEGGFVERL
jgi:hypothetical protein